jgi:transketolase
MASRKELANAIRVLSIDAVQKAKSGHPGAPMGMADMAEVLWNDFLKHNPADPFWPDRDRFVLSNGHASMLLYSLLHLTGYDLNIEEIKKFRCLHSNTPGHPECMLKGGVETTTGPLGQGLANGVGMAVAERVLAEQFNQGGHKIVDHFTYVFLGDGCMMEGISHEACSLAGTLGLGKLIAVYDDNGISIDGQVQGWFSDNTPMRFSSYGWHVIRDVDGHDGEAIKQAIQEARNVTDRPSLICCKTKIAFGSPNLAGSHKTHGSPLGEDEVEATRRMIGWSEEPFFIPQAIYEAWDARSKGSEAQTDWEERYRAYKRDYPELAREFERRMRGELPTGFAERADDAVTAAHRRAKNTATRKASGQALEDFGPLLPELFGGSADLSGSTNTVWSGSTTVQHNNWDGNFLHYGVREFAMAAIMNGLGLHGGFRPYGGTFLMFSDYARNGMRMASLMGVRSIFVLTHDSIGVGEDGPTHQPIEQTASLRIIPNMYVWRPCDAVETVAAWRWALENESGPCSLVLSRQSLPHQDREESDLANIRRGGYVLLDSEQPLQAVIIATGSEVDIAVRAAKKLQKQGRRVRVVSMPSVEVFEEQDPGYRRSVLPPEVTARVAVEAGVPDFWYKFVGIGGRVVGIERFGESAPAGDLFEYFGFTPENVARAVEETMIEEQETVGK